MIKSIRLLHTRLIGSTADTPLQARIFHEVSVIAMVGLPFALLVNIFIKVPMVNIAISVTWIVVVAMYINSRYFGGYSLVSFYLAWAPVSLWRLITS